MSIKSDKWIRRTVHEQRMIEPFAAEQVRAVDGHKIISYGTSSYGYDVRCAPEFKIFTNINSTIVDPKAFDAKSFVDFVGDVCIIPPNSFALARTVEYFRIPRSVLTICLGKSTYARCFRGDTRVALVDGGSATLEDMARRHEGGEMFWGYSVGPNGRIIVTLLDKPRYIARDTLLQITLDNQERIHATPDHIFLRRDGCSASASELRPGDSLMPLYRDLRRGHECVYQPVNGNLLATHRLADEWNVRNKIYASQPGTHRHHREFDRKEHSASIRAALGRLAPNEQWRRQFSRSQAQRARDFWHETRFAKIRQRVIEARRNPPAATREADRIASLARFSDRARRQRLSLWARQAWSDSDPSRRLAQAEVARQINLRPEVDVDRVRRTLDNSGSIRRVARALECDRPVFRRFPERLADVRGRGVRNHKVVAIDELPGEHDVYCLSVPEAGNFALQAGVFVNNCGIIVNVTPLEPEWEGHVTLEFSNTTPLPAKIYANEGVAQMLFFEADEICETSYKDRGGKYMGQQGVTLPKA
jgi:deoxycytidine triphosphate deaminase